MSGYGEGQHLCMDCGNAKRFKMLRDWSLRATTEDVWDCEDEGWYEEQEASDNIEDGEVDDAYDLECYECGSSDIKNDIDDDELLELRVLHTDTNGKWSKDELEEDEQNEKLKAELAEERL